VSAPDDHPGVTEFGLGDLRLTVDGRLRNGRLLVAVPRNPQKSACQTCPLVEQRVARPGDVFVGDGEAT